MSLRKFKNPKTNSIREENDLFDWIKALGFEYGTILRIGGQVTGQILMESGQLPEELILKYKSIFESDITYYLEKRRLVSKASDIAVSYTHHIEEVQEEQGKQNELIRVWDDVEECYRNITKARYAAESWRFKIVVKKPETDEEEVSD